MEKEKKVQERTIINRKKILEVAKELFRSKGYYNTNTKEISRAAGVAIGSFYNYYPDKLTIFLEIFMDYINQNYSNIINLFKNLDENPKAAKIIISNYVKDGMNRAYDSLEILRNYDSIARANPQLKKIENETNEKVMETIIDFFSNSPNIKKRANPIIMAHISFFTVQGISEYLTKLPKDTNLKLYEEQLADIIYWYMYGD